MAGPGRRRHRAVLLKPIVAVAMSGGVDSSVAAALCAERGHQVVGIMLRLWAEPGSAGANRCCTPSAVHDARRVADHLSIPFSVIDAVQAFRDRVVDDFVARARAGDTPNPCFKCNRRVRFGLLLERARALGAERLATGHYARVEPGSNGPRLLRGTDTAKDQSYMLHELTRSQLARAEFPVGGMTKGQVRDKAARLGLPVADRKDSVDLCWVGEGGVPGFLEREIPAAEMAPGPIVATDGREVGRHEGLARYTLGQRRGLGVALGEAVYVLERDFAGNRLIVGPEEALMARRVAARPFHWIGGTPRTGEMTAKLRYGAQPAACAVEVEADCVTVTFHAPQRAPTPGQGLVVYDGDEVLGGGPIVTSDGREACYTRGS